MKLLNLLTISSAYLIAVQADGSLPQKNDYICEQKTDCPETTITLQQNQVLKCFGEESCKGKTITVNNVNGKKPNYIECYGEDSCYGTTVHVTKNSEIYCLGSQACKAMNIISDVKTVYAWGEEAFMDGTIADDVTVLEYSVLGEDGFDDVASKLARSSSFLAYQSARDTKLYSKGEDVELEFAGFDSTTNMELYCEQGSSCFVNCIDCTVDDGSVSSIIYVTDDSKLKLNCPFKGYSCDGLVVSYPSLDQVEITGPGADDVTLTLETQTRRLERIQNNNKNQPQIKASTNNPKHRKLGSELCRDFKECENKVFDTTDSIYCDGTLSCLKSTNSDTYESSIYVTGFKAGAQSQLTAKKFEVEGMLGLLNADVTADSVDIEGYRGGMRATFRAKGDSLHVDSHAVHGLKGATIICEEGKSCELECNAFQSCAGAILDCRATDQECKQTCDELFHGCATEVPDCTEITTGPIGCRANKFCFWVNDSCKNKEQATCDELSTKDCHKSNGVCMMKQGKCTFNEARRPIPRPEFPIRI